MKGTNLIKYLGIITLVAACGQLDQDTANNKNDAYIEVSDGIQEQTGMETAKLVDAVASLPECIADVVGSLYYAIDAQQFFYCDESGWEVIDLKGADGEDGLAGADGQKGDKGDKGDKGETGAPGEDGKDAINLGANEWEHPINDSIWFLGQKGLAKVLFPKSCPTGSRKPTQSEVEDAISAGLFTDLADFFDSATTMAIFKAEGSGLEAYVTYVDTADDFKIKVKPDVQLDKLGYLVCLKN